MDCIPQNEKGAYYIDVQECIACGKCAEEWPEGVLCIKGGAGRGAIRSQEVDN